MIEELLVRFTETRHRWLIVTAVTLVIALASILPQVDQCLQDRSERAALNAHLEQSAITLRELPTYRQRVAVKVEELAALRDREVSESQLTGLRSWLVRAARESGCQVRRIDLASPTARPWGEKDHPLEPPANAKAKTPFYLQTRPVAFSVTGAEPEVFALLKALDADPRLRHTRALELKPNGRNSRELQLDLTLWYFALVEGEGAA